MISRLITYTFVWVSLILVTHVNAASRVALVIGNSTYTEVSPLRNPQNDANALAKSLEDLDFKVVLGIDLDHRGFIKKIKEFSKVSAGADVALFFYAGHGLQVDGSNFLLPVDAAIADETDLAFEAIDLNIVLKMMEREDRVNLVFLDACRDNPMSRSLSRSMGTRSSSVGKGLAPIDSGSGTLIGFATQPGNVALDGEGTVNSPFTTALLKHIATPNLDVAQLMRRVRVDVKQATNGRQIPWTSESLTSDFAFKTGRPVDVVHVEPGEPRQVVVTNPIVNNTVPNNQAELAFWNSVKDNNDIGLFEEYIKQYPKGSFVAIARFHIEKLSSIKIAALPKQQQIVKPDRSAIARASLRGCDLAAANSSNPDNPPYSPGVDYEKIVSGEAIAACAEAVQNNPDSQRAIFQLARSYASSGNDIKAVKAVRLYRQGAESGYVSAQNNLGYMYGSGKGVTKNYKQAVSWYRKAAEQGYAPGQTNLGTMYRNGYGVTKDSRQAVAWYRKAAEQGNADGQHNLGFMYHYGKGVTKNYKQAVSWYRKAAEQGDAGGQYNLGGMYEYGEGIAKDPKQAAKWYYKGLTGKNKWSFTRTNLWDISTLKALQRLLKNAGYYTSTIDGRMGPGTRRAMKALCDCG
ncbi:MAG: SEL1-like repeat protein [Cohaesibacteraceae bacterium]|nr:SEL1-like repeat protein [Cohaesibacteraceae bacterium]MBL4876853.1 SEL1-like repeat protein [Cohaesibacteraceae bacterium]